MQNVTKAHGIPQSGTVATSGGFEPTVVLSV